MSKNKVKQLFPQPIKERYGSLLHPIRIYKRLTARVYFKPFFILGHAKSGTTAISSLLSKATGKSVTIDLFYQIKNSPQNKILDEVYDGKISFKEFIDRNKFYFSTPLNKSPKFTQFHGELSQIFPGSKFIFIVRDPRDNIRSLLNRRKVPGNLSSFPGNEYYQLDAFSDASLPGKTYIEKIAYGWCRAVEKYTQNQGNRSYFV